MFTQHNTAAPTTTPCNKTRQREAEQLSLCPGRSMTEVQGKGVSGSRPPVSHSSFAFFLPGHGEAPLMEGKMAAILQLSQYCTFRMDSISTVITEPGQPVSHCVGQRHPSCGCITLSEGSPWSEGLKDPLLVGDVRRQKKKKDQGPASGEAEILKGPVELY